MSQTEKTETKKPKTHGTKLCMENLLAKGAFSAAEPKTEYRQCGAYLMHEVRDVSGKVLVRNGECPNKRFHGKSQA